MNMPFPGMDPYLEHPALWPGLHARLIVALADQLSPRIRPRYVASVEDRVFLETPHEQRIPDVWLRKIRDDKKPLQPGTATAAPIIVEVEELEVREHYIEILDLYRDQRVVTVIELVSPSNKLAGSGRESYVKKQQATLQSESHLVEIDLLRRGQHVLSVPELVRLGRCPDADYLACVSRWPNRKRYELYPGRLRDPLPLLRVPLTDPDPDVPLDLQAAVEHVYVLAGYALRVRYEEPCHPALGAADQQWGNERWAAFRATRPDLFPPAQA